MPTSFENAVQRYVKARSLSRSTRRQYSSTLRKWKRWGNGVAIESLSRPIIREFLDWVHDDAVKDNGTNPGRTTNKARQNLRAVMSWAWEQDILESLPRFPKRRQQRDVAGRHYLTKAELNAIYFATHQMRRPRSWQQPEPVGRYWRAALVFFFNYGVDYADLQIMRSTFIAMSRGDSVVGYFPPWTCPCAPHYPVSLLRGS